jgi:rhamnosyltransferase
VNPVYGRLLRRRQESCRRQNRGARGTLTGRFMDQTVDVVIPVYKPDRKFQMILDRLAVQDYPVSRIIIINTDEKYYPKGIRQPDNMELIHIRKEEFDHGTTRNLGARMSDADFILFMTEDAVPMDRHLIGNLLKPFSDEKVAASYGRQVPNREHSRIEKFTRNFNYPAQSSVKSSADLGRLGIKTFFCSDACAMYRKSVFNEQGGFLPQAIFNEDMLYASTLIYAGYKIAYQADARVIHSHDYTAVQQFRRNFDNGVSQAVNFRTFGSVPSYGEGMKLVKATARHLVRTGHPLDCVPLFFISAAKFTGFVLGRRYYLLPRPLVLKITLNPGYWE